MPYGILTADSKTGRMGCRYSAPHLGYVTARSARDTSHESRTLHNIIDALHGHEDITQIPEYYTMLWNHGIPGTKLSKRCTRPASTWGHFIWARKAGGGRLTAMAAREVWCWGSGVGPVRCLGSMSHTSNTSPTTGHPPLHQHHTSRAAMAVSLPPAFLPSFQVKGESHIGSIFNKEYCILEGETIHNIQWTIRRASVKRTNLVT